MSPVDPFDILDGWTWTTSSSPLAPEEVVTWSGEMTSPVAFAGVASTTTTVTAQIGSPVVFTGEV